MTSHLLTDESSRKRIADLIMRLPDDKYEVEIKPFVANRTVLQNRLMWHWLGHLSNETGHTKEELHNIAKMEILGVEHIRALGYKVVIPKSTTDLNVKDFIDYLTQFEAFFASKGLVLPAPSYYQEAMKR